MKIWPWTRFAKLKASVRLETAKRHKSDDAAAKLLDENTRLFGLKKLRDDMSNRIRIEVTEDMNPMLMSMDTYARVSIREEWCAHLCSAALQAESELHPEYYADLLCKAIFPVLQKTAIEKMRELKLSIR